MEGADLAGVAERFKILSKKKKLIRMIYRGEDLQEVTLPIRFPSFVDIFRQEDLVRFVHLHLPNALPFLDYARNHYDPTTQMPCLKRNIDYAIETHMKQAWDPSASTP